MILCQFGAKPYALNEDLPKPIPAPGMRPSEPSGKTLGRSA